MKHLVVCLCYNNLRLSTRLLVWLTQSLRNRPQKEIEDWFQAVEEVLEVRDRFHEERVNLFLSYDEQSEMGLMFVLRKKANYRHDSNSKMGASRRCLRLVRGLCALVDR